MWIPELFAFPAATVEARWASPENPRGLRGGAGTENAGRKGRPNVPVRAGESWVLAEEGPGVTGTVRRIWLTIPDRSPLMLRGVRLDFYWDGAEAPAVSAPLGDFFGVGLGRTARFDCALFGFGPSGGFCATLPMPFRSGMRMVLTNETDCDIPMLFYDMDYTVGDAHGPDILYLHTHYRRENPTTLQRDYELLPRVTGRGRFLGVNFGVIPNRPGFGRTWWGEGEVKMYLDGDDDLPTLCGTGTEDYVGAAWGLEAFTQLYQGCPIADDVTNVYCFYRYHVPDPIWFRRDIRVTIQQIGHASPELLAQVAAEKPPLYRAGLGLAPLDLSSVGPGGALFERSDDWSSVAYFYLDGTINRLPILPPLAERIAGL